MCCAMIAWVLIEFKIQHVVKNEYVLKYIEWLRRELLYGFAIQKA